MQRNRRLGVGAAAKQNQKIDHGASLDKFYIGGTGTVYHEPWLGNVAFMSRLEGPSNIDSTPFLFACTGVLAAIAVFRYRVLDPIPSLTQAHRRPAEELHGVVDDVIKVLEAKVQPDLRRGRYPDKRAAHRVAEMVRAVANELEL